MPNSQNQTKPNNLNIAKQPKQTKQLKQCQTAKPNQTKELIFFKVKFTNLITLKSVLITRKKTQEGNFDEKKNQTVLKGNFNHTVKPNNLKREF